MIKHNIDYYVKNDFDNKSIINRTVLTQTSTDVYDITIKPKIIVLSAIPSFSHLEIRVEEGAIVEYNYHYNYVIYGILILMLIGVFIMYINSGTIFYPLTLIIGVFVIVIYKILGVYQLRKIANKIE